MASKTAKLRAASARAINLRIRANDLADQLEDIGRGSDASTLRAYARQIARMAVRLGADADLARDPRGAHSASVPTEKP